MNGKIRFFTESLKLVWQSAPGWASANIALSALQSVLPLALLWLLKNVIDIITSASSTGLINSFLFPVIALVSVWFLDEALGGINNYVRQKQSLKFEDHMYGLLHSKAASIDLIHFENPAYFDCLSRASSEAIWRPNSILHNLLAISRSLLSLALMTGLVASLNIWPAALLLISNIPGIWLRLYYADILYDFHRQNTPESRKATYFNWLLTGDKPARELRLFGLGGYFREQFRKSFLWQKVRELEIIRKRTLIGLVSDLFKAGAFFVTVFFISRETMAGRITIGQMAMFLVAFRQGMMYIKDLFGSIAALYEDGLFIGDTFEFLNLNERMNDLEPASVPGKLKKNIVAEHLTFSYPGSSGKTLDDISFEINEGEIVAIVGHNGAGKSTLAKLLTRLYDPDSGMISYDGINIRHFNPDEYRKLFSVVFQDFMLYNLTAGENIRLGNLDEINSAQGIRRAANKANIDAFIGGLPNGYETPIGNLFSESRELSWGEWQKIALARAFYRDASVLILDEPSSALDPDSEFEIFSRLKENLKGRTAILITHRFTNVLLADRIIVLQKGAIAESGTHEDLMKARGLYWSMYSKQSSRFKG